MRKVEKQLKSKRQIQILPIISSILILYRRAISIMFAVLMNLNASLSIAIICLFAVLLFIIWCFMVRKIQVYPQYSVIMIMLVMLLLSLIFVPNQIALGWFRDFVLYCATGALILSYVYDYERWIKIYCYISTAIFFFCAPLPIITRTLSYHDMGYFESGMMYGEWVMLPSFIGLFLLSKRYHIRWINVPVILNLILILLFANRSSFLSAIVFMVLYDLSIESKKNRKIVIRWGILILIALFLMIYLQDILSYMQNQILNPMGIHSRALQKYIVFLSSDTVDTAYLTSGRNSISQIAWGYIKEHWLFGIGVGMFTQYTGIVYTHNIITDAYSSFGIIGGSFIIIISAIAIYYTFKEKEESHRTFLLVFFIMCFPRLLFSKTFINDVPFWMYIVCSMFRKVTKNTECSILSLIGNRV